MDVNNMDVVTARSSGGSISHYNDQQRVDTSRENDDELGPDVESHYLDNNTNNNGASMLSPIHEPLLLSNRMRGSSSSMSSVPYGAAHGVPDTHKLNDDDVDRKQRGMHISLDLASMPMQKYLEERWYSRAFMRVMMLDWNYRDKRPVGALLLLCYYLFGAGLLLFVTIVLSQYIFMALYENKPIHFSPTAKYLICLFYANFLLQIVSGSFSVYCAGKRLNKASGCYESELKYILPSVRRCIYFIILFWALGLIGAGLAYRALDPKVVVEELLAMTVLTLSSCGAVTSNLLFVYIDCRVSTDMLQALRKAVTCTSLTITELVAVKADIDKRHRSCQMPNVMMGFNALVSTLTFIFAIYIANDTSGATLTLSVAWYCKEIAYLFMALYDTSNLNHLSEKLTYELGTKLWNEDQELLRLQLFANLQAKPIAFTFLGTKPTPWTVLYQVGTMLIAILVSIVRAIVLHT
jgi:hypothetical protein